MTARITKEETRIQSVFEATDFSGNSGDSEVQPGQINSLPYLSKFAAQPQPPDEPTAAVGSKRYTLPQSKSVITADLPKRRKAILCSCFAEGESASITGIEQILPLPDVFEGYG